MRTRHRVLFADARHMSPLDSGFVEVVVTSPPYPMIEMWDEVFARQDPGIREALSRNDGWPAFERMHRILDSVWTEVHRVLVDGGIACINAGDATRTLGGRFALYPNHARILTHLVGLGFTPLPSILWRKQTNAPNKFMGSGMLPPGAYVTLEHEHVLIVRKGDKRVFASEADKRRRRESAFFWEERNQWFSDVWFDLKGAAQELADSVARERSGAFPFELAYRLISMFSVKGDTVLDPFLGLGTTMLAAMATARNSIGFELDASLGSAIAAQVETVKAVANARIEARLAAHEEFIRNRGEAEETSGYPNRFYGFPVVTRQETELVLNELLEVRGVNSAEYEVEYARSSRSTQTGESGQFSVRDPDSEYAAAHGRVRRKRGSQRKQLDFFSEPGEKE